MLGDQHRFVDRVGGAAALVGIRVAGKKTRFRESLLEGAQARTVARAELGRG